MTDQVLTRLEGRDICYEDWMGQVHACRGVAARRRAPVYTTLCRLDVPPGRARGRARHEVVTCPDCFEVLCEPARRILAAPLRSERDAVGGLPFEPDWE